MSLTPRITLDDDDINGLSCAICGNPNLKIVHVETYPDFVICDRCDSAFVIENEGSWIMYGKIPPEYPMTREFALRQWTWMDAVAQRAADDREARGIPSPPSVEPEISAVQRTQKAQASPPPAKEEARITPEKIQPTPPQEAKRPEVDLPSGADQKTPPIEKRTAPVEEVSKVVLKETPPEAVSEPKADAEKVFTPPPVEKVATPGEAPPASREKKPPAAPAETKAAPMRVPVGEPEPGKRYRVTIRGSQPRYPHNVCAHCLQTPVKLKAIMRGNLPDPDQPGYRKLVPLTLPFCSECQKRMNERSEEESNARLLTYLFSALVALIAVVATLAFRLVDLNADLGTSVIVLLVVAILGFTFPFLISMMLNKRYPMPPDAAFVFSTLLVFDAGEEITQFEWRNPGYAELFRQVNQNNVLGGLQVVKDRTDFSQQEPAEMTQQVEQLPDEEKQAIEPEGETESA
jgi:hypothetical protein